jgi:tetratricopeptide (TPR) repeat protein
MRKSLILILFAFYTSSSLFAQLPAYFSVNAKYKNAFELFEQEKFAAASAAFYEVEKTNNTTTPQYAISSEVSNLKVNAEFYRAVCALELQNDDAVQLFKQFIKNHPESPKSKQSAFYVGKYFFNLEQFEESLNWFTKVSSIDLTGKEDTEYKFKTAYAYLKTNDFASAKPLFGLVKDVSSVTKSNLFITMRTLLM